jgi:hypothetical protein
MFEELFSVLLEGLAGWLAEFVGEVLGGMIEGVGGTFSGGQPRGDEGRAVERYKFRPRDLGG